MSRADDGRVGHPQRRANVWRAYGATWGEKEGAARSDRNRDSPAKRGAGGGKEKKR